VTNSIVLQIARAYTPAPIARHQRSSTQLTSLLINNAGALGSAPCTSTDRCGWAQPCWAISTIDDARRITLIAVAA
ncbi:hypothetical protein, partial [Mycobacterium pseudoshottsii]|uniref:hypothetical protein n=1 Tax=Mycobacterium pseudoshottsii TaxID=265949 RepID=UPI003FD89317